MPQYKDFLKDSEIITLKAGVSFDDSNRDSSKISPIAGVRWSRPNRVVGSETMYFSYSETTQVLGYTALAQALGFTGDPNLRRGSSKNLELGYEVSNSKWKFSGQFSKRWDDDLVDWVYDINDTRSARHVDMETFGFELIASRSWQNFQTIGGYLSRKR